MTEPPGRRSDGPEPQADAPEPSLLDGVFMEHGGDGDESGEGGLDLDDSQADEIRNIFLTTLPQYIEPIEQMMEQVFSDGQPDEATCQALGAAIGSISAAASRIGIDDVWRELERMVHQVDELSEGAAPEEVRLHLAQGLAAIRQIVSTDDPGHTEGQDAPSRTLFDALRDAPAIDASILEKFTAAGLVNIDQLMMARSHEITAVTGLPDGAVQDVLAAIRRINADSRGGEASTPQEVTEFTRQVDAEASLEEVRARNTHILAEVASLKGDLESATGRRDELRRQLARARDELAARQPTLSDVRRHRDTLDSKRSRRVAELEHTASRLAAQRRNERTARSDDAGHAETVSELVQRVKRLIDRGV